MSKSLDLARDVLALVFQGAPLPKAYGEAIFVSLHTAAPGDQADHEASYHGYRRARTERGTAAWKSATRGGAARVENAALIAFPLNSGSERSEVTHFGIGLKERGAGRLLYAAQLRAPLLVLRNIEPRFAPGALAILEG